MQDQVIDVCDSVAVLQVEDVKTSAEQDLCDDRADKQEADSRKKIERGADEKAFVSLIVGKSWKAGEKKWKLQLTSLYYIHSLMQQKKALKTRYFLLLF